ncbi:hypothetical protein M419DRAFT_9594 [Trichoderma reesei RUT C-30]|uniref:Uncharacterized protein n=1 Tax=Hypocrea jecorina (strain ATCC 56765 / BCRC 32924 / NRRL 11460 / Rut C-30) TaxID=1344414 RepID=A0A024S6K8_HYPJR|nr:hypothetical protein M419DRAFT_9594 [Trichoderma reesei RUT C-30]
MPGQAPVADKHARRRDAAQPFENLAQVQTLNKRSRFPKLALSHKHYAVFTLRSHFLLAHKTQMEPYILATKASVHGYRAPADGRGEFDAPQKLSVSTTRSDGERKAKRYTL